MIIRAYSIGIFPMAASRGDRHVQWIAPSLRGILPLDQFHVPRRLKRTLKQSPLAIRCDTAFAQVIEACASPRPDHPDTWINDEIARVFTELHRLGDAHSVEAWNGDRLVGGLYGVALGAAFFGESMFSIETDASKVALIHLVARLRLGRFVLLDVQFVTDHLRRFGAIEIPAPVYLHRLDQALKRRASFYCDPPAEELEVELSSLAAQSRTQTS
jgi:leucyl/phenylalanyl-tRNA--protein transferase